MEELKKFTKWYYTVGLCVTFVVCIMLYAISIEGLVKPAGLMEAFQFLLTNPKEYTICLLCGVIVTIATGGLLIEALVSILYVIAVFIQGDYEYEDARKHSIVTCAANCILFIVACMMQSEVLVGFSSLFWVIVVIFLIVFLWSYKK